MGVGIIQYALLLGSIGEQVRVWRIAKRVHSFKSRIAPPNSASLDTNDAVPEMLKILRSFRLMAPNNKNIYGKVWRLRATRTSSQ